MNQPPLLSVITVNWNTRALLQQLLRSIYAHAPKVPFEIIVVDNGSRDGSPDMVRDEFPDVRLIRNAENEGFAKASNLAAASARGELSLLLGSDTVVLEGSLDTMSRYLLAHPEVGAVACRLLNPDGTVQASCHRFPGLIDGILTYTSLHALAPHYNMRSFNYNSTQEVEQPAATCFLVRTSIIRKIGLFDEAYSILYNDVDLCKRIWVGGWKIVYLGDAEILHHGSQSTRCAHPALRLEMYRNILLYYFRHFGVPAIIVLLPILFVRLAIVNKGKRLSGLLSFRYLS